MDPKRDANVTAEPNGKEVQMNRAYEQVPQINAPVSTTSEEASKTEIVNNELSTKGKNSAVDSAPRGETEEDNTQKRPPPQNHNHNTNTSDTGARVSTEKTTNNSDTPLEYFHIPVASNKLIQPGQHFHVPSPDTRLGPDGQTGYVHDPKFLVKNPPQFSIPDHEREGVCKPLGQGFEGELGSKQAQKIRNHIETSTASRDVKLFCVVYTFERRNQ